MPVQAKPEGYHSVTPYLVCKDAAKALDFYKTAFGATELMRMPGPDGSIMHAEFKIGDSPVMLGEESPEWEAHSPLSLGGSPVGLCIYVENCDAVFDRAVAAGATVKRAVQNQFYGDRSGTVTDPFGHQWTISTHKEDIPPEQMMQRFEAWMSQQSIA